MPNVNTPDTENIKLAWTHQEERRRQPLKKNDGHGCTGEEKKGRPKRTWMDSSREDMKKYELTDDGEDWPIKMWRWSLKVRR